MVSKGGVTSGSLIKDKWVGEVFGGQESVALRFDVLMTLYVLTALGEAEMSKSGRSLAFAAKKS